MDLCCECQASGQELTLNSLCLSFWKKEDSCLHNIIPTTPLRLWGLVSGGIIQDVVRVQIPALSSVLVPLSRAELRCVPWTATAPVWGAASSSGDAPDLQATVPSVAVPNFTPRQLFPGLDWDATFVTLESLH